MSDSSSKDGKVTILLPQETIDAGEEAMKLTGSKSPSEVIRKAHGLYQELVKSGDSAFPQDKPA